MYKDSKLVLMAGVFNLKGRSKSYERKEIESETDAGLVKCDRKRPKVDGSERKVKENGKTREEFI